MQLILVILGMTALWLSSFGNRSIPHCAHQLSILCPWVISFNEFGGGIFARILTILLLMGAGFILTFSLSSNQMISRQTYLPALLLPVFASYTPLLQTFHPVIPAVFLLVLALHFILAAYEKNDLTKDIFSAGILISLAALFHLPVILFAILPFITLAIYRIFDWRQWAAALAGIFTPLLYTFSIVYYLNGFQFIREWISFVKPVVGIHIPEMEWEIWLFWGLIGIILLRAIGSILWHSGERVISFRKRQIIILWFLILSQLGLLISGPAIVYQSVLLFIPMAFYFTYLFIDKSLKREWLGNFFLFLLFSALLLMYLYSDDVLTQGL